MAPPVVGKRYRGWATGRGDFIGRCVSAKGEFWEFKLESIVKGMCRCWCIGDVIAVRAACVGSLVEIPLDVEGK